jgi:hypothetical protein
VAALDGTAVRVQRAPRGDETFVLCEADVFETDRLTITVTETQQVMAVFEPGTWFDATVTDARGNPLAYYQSTRGHQDQTARIA